MTDPSRASQDIVNRLREELARLEHAAPPDQRDADLEDAAGDAGADPTGGAGTPTGIGEALDGKVRITVSAGHVSEVVLEPRALRTPSEELAAAIRDATNAAIDAQNAEVTSGLPGVPSLADLTSTLDEFSAESLRAMAESSRGIRDAIATVQRIAELHRRRLT
ncbi:YbaB/EbfC family nucleoid-associated protein [Actinopolymorpha sp. B11F2]|uniref:YbaB/EbfC family nucleoid-associated protein n=1 Tax=Actinopolymorpha sp. B11F2 TaxID=3160862 RepID=UPI0032E44EBB